MLGLPPPRLSSASSGRLMRKKQPHFSLQGQSERQFLSLEGYPACSDSQKQQFVTLEAIHTLARISLRLVLAELQDLERKQTGELPEGRRRCSESVPKWGHLELTFPICSTPAPFRACVPQGFPRQVPEGR